jgi:hypothetical protein
MLAARAVPPFLPPIAPCFLKKSKTSGGNFLLGIAHSTLPRLALQVHFVVDIR